MAPEAAGHRPRRTILLIGVAALVIIVLSLFLLPFGGDGDPDSLTVTGHPLHGEPAPEIDLVTLDGERVTLSALRGQPVLINFWASWCAPCRAEFPLMVETYAAYADQGLEILGVVHDDSTAAAAAFALEQEAAWPMPVDADSVAWDDYLVTGKPTSFFVDPEGIVQALSLGPFSEDSLERQLATILNS